MSDDRSDDLVTFLNEHFHPDETLAKSIGLVLDEEMDIIIKKMVQRQSFHYTYF